MECYYCENGCVNNVKHSVVCGDCFVLALAVFTRSPAAYDALKSFKLLQLPSKRTLKDYIDANLEGAGECLERLQEERKHYLKKIEEQRKTKVSGLYSYSCKITLFICEAGNLLPTGEGVLVIDKVKVN